MSYHVENDAVFHLFHSTFTAITITK